MAYESRYDPNRKADLSKQSARGKRIARRGRDIKEFRKSLPPFPDPASPFTFRQKEYDYSPHWRDVDPEQLRKKEPGSDAKAGFLKARGDAGQMWSDLSGSVKEFGPVKDFTTMVGDIGSMVKFPSGLLSLIPALGIGESIEQNEENERILGDAYTDKVRKEMMSPSDKEFYDKYMRLASFASGPEAENYRNIAKQALENAQVTRRVNYALGNLGFDTSAEAGKAAFGETPKELKERIDYGALKGNLQRGLEDTKSGKAFLKEHAIPKSGDTPEITRAIENFYGGQSRLALDEELNTRIPPSIQQRIIPKIKPTYKPEGWDEQFLFPPPPEEELPAYSDVPVSILEDYGESNVGLIGPGTLEGYLDRDLEEDELYNERLYKALNTDPNTLPGWKYTDVNPFVTPYDFPMENPPREPMDEYWIGDENWTGRHFGPVGMDVYRDREEEKGRGLLWEPPWNYQI